MAAVTVSSEPIEVTTFLIAALPAGWKFDSFINVEGLSTRPLSSATTGTYAPWNHSTYLDVNRARGRTYPPKDAMPWLHGSYPGMEYFVNEGYPPWGSPATPTPEAPVGAGEPTPDLCAGRSLLAMANPTNIACMEPVIVDLTTQGAVGNVDWTLLDPLSNNMTLEDLVVPLNDCAGTDGGFITFAACDDCCRLYGGFSTVSVFVEGCEPTACESAGRGITCAVVDEPCVEIEQGTSKAFILEGSVGAVTWTLDVSGAAGASVDENGEVTAEAAACGTIILKAEDCCGLQTLPIRITDGAGGGAGVWDLISETRCDSEVQKLHFAGCCEVIIEGLKKEVCRIGWVFGTASCPCQPTGTPKALSGLRLRTFQWICPP